MENSFHIRDFTIVIIANRHNPSILNPDFLKFNNIVPKDWELKKAPICIEPFSEVAFKNNVNVRAEINKLTFFEKLSEKDPYHIEIDEIAKKYTEVLPHVDHLAVGLNFTGHISFENNPEGPKEYIMTTLIANGPWCEYGEDRSASISFAFKLGRTQLNLTIKESTLNGEQKGNLPILFFDSNFHKELAGSGREEKLKDLHEILSKWTEDFEEFKRVIENVFHREG